MSPNIERMRSKRNTTPLISQPREPGIIGDIKTVEKHLKG